MAQTRLVIFDDFTHIILCSTPSPAVAQMLMFGTYNVHLTSLPDLEYRFTKWGDIDFNSIDRHKLSPGWKIEHIDRDSLSADVIAKRQLVQTKLFFLTEWEIMCNTSIAKNQNAMTSTAAAFITAELQTGSSSAFIQEYAEINDIPLESAIQELHRKVRSRGMVEARVWAQFEKYGQQIALSATGIEMAAALDRGNSTLLVNI